MPVHQYLNISNSHLTKTNFFSLFLILINGVNLCGLWAMEKVPLLMESAPHHIPHLNLTT